MTAELTSDPVRKMAAQDIGLAPRGIAAEFDDPDSLTDLVADLLEDYGGVIFSGPPGTSKSWFAEKVAKALAGDESRVRFVQFHPSYQYEDFVRGYVPDETADGRFMMQSKHLVLMCEAAEKSEDLHVLVIDELSRGDAARVFGEALTYVERTKRGQRFYVASGHEMEIPDNLAFVCTMNPLDRGVDQVDAAFERRFARISMQPRSKMLRTFLEANDMDSDVIERVVVFFDGVNNLADTNPYAALGHAYFINVTDETDLERLWDHQLRFLFERAFQLDADGFARVESLWSQVLKPKLSGGLAEDEDAVE